MKPEEHFVPGENLEGQSFDAPISRIFLLRASGEGDRAELIPYAAPQKEPFEDWVRSEIKRRMKRGNLFPPDILGEPCWDMLLDLASAAIDARVISVSSACLASGVPQTTALRWLQLLEKYNLVSRAPHPADGRRTNVTITEAGMAALRTYHARNLS